MFTGIIQKTGTVVDIEQGEGAGTLQVDANPWATPLSLGESISINGTCLSLTRQVEHVLSFDILRETFDKTTLGTLIPGRQVNLERALAHGEPLGGHIVSGHVDGVGKVRTITPVDRDRRVEITCSPELHSHLISKGSITCDGISLTVAELLDDGFAVHIIPITLEHTHWSCMSEGDGVNLEVDLIGKYIESYIKQGLYPEPVTWDRLRRSGFLPGKE
ncbi:MAG: riboflavin synthase [Kiritimatiellia bacterium]|jgi:riboflavin synthase